jgi:hypothetical protein
VALVNARNEQPARGIMVRWQVVQGSGAVLSADSTATAVTGVASVHLRLGPEPGLYRVQARAENVVGGPVTLDIQAVHPPRIESIVPAGPVATGDTVVIRGSNFSTNPDENDVLFGGMRGRVLAASATELRVVVPLCVPTRTVTVVVALGPVAGAGVPLGILGTHGAPLALPHGGVLRLFDPAELACIVLPAGPDQSYLLVPQNAGIVAGASMPFRLFGLAGSPPTTATFADHAGVRLEPVPVSGFGDAAAAFESRIRRLERALPPGSALPPALPGVAGDIAATQLPAIGSRREFNVYNKDGKFTKVQAEARHVSQRAILYQDVNAPTGGFTDVDFRRFAELFDDPIHSTVVRVYGQPSDVDGNGRVIILFTPVVNEMTPRGTPGYIAGFFYGLDLTVQTGSNRAEIFYSVVPDPTGRHGDVRLTSTLLRGVPPILAHEFQHMVHFNERVLVRSGPGQEVLWLAEALAHMAEEITSLEFLARGDEQHYVDFRAANFARARLYLQRPHETSIIIPDTEAGSLELRGGAWLLLHYLMGHHGGEELLRRLTQTTLSGVSNVAQQAGQPWSALFNDYALALWADDAPELAGVSIDPRLTFTRLDLRRDLQRWGNATFPLAPTYRGFEDFNLTGALPASSAGFIILRSGSQERPLFLSMAGAAGGTFNGGRPQLSILRLR